MQSKMNWKNKMYCSDKMPPKLNSVIDSLNIFKWGVKYILHWIILYILFSITECIEIYVIPHCWVQNPDEWRVQLSLRTFWHGPIFPASQCDPHSLHPQPYCGEIQMLRNTAHSLLSLFSNYKTHSHMWPSTTKPVISHTGIFVAIANITLYGSKLSNFLLCQKSLGY